MTGETSLVNKITRVFLQFQFHFYLKPRVILN